jgi:DNA-binding NarL/FixJ family response regulator
MATPISALIPVPETAQETVETLAAARATTAPHTTSPQDEVTISPGAQQTGQTVSGRVASLRAEGESIGAIAEQLGLTPQAVEGYLGIQNSPVPA